MKPERNTRKEIFVRVLKLVGNFRKKSILCIIDLFTGAKKCNQLLKLVGCFGPKVLTYKNYFG